jgi:uncharacterized protein DUF6894
MTIYYFNIQIGDTPRSIDEEGHGYPDVETARAEAGRVLCDVSRDMLRSGKVSNMTVWVRDDLGAVMFAQLQFHIQRSN